MPAIARPDQLTINPAARLGAGGMGEVFLGRIGETEWVAVKRIRADLRHRGDLRAQFEREARICALLTHPCIVKLRLWGEDELGPFLVLEYVHGRSLKDLVEHHRRQGELVTLPIASSIGRDAVEALSYAHNLTAPALGVKGIIHRDISPDNLLISYDGELKLTDFGVARLIGASQLTRAPTLKGKAGFIAPELYDGAEADASTDVFALGVTLYYLFTGMMPFQGKTDAEMMRAVFATQPLPMHQRRPEVQRSFSDLVSRAMHKRREARPGLRELETELSTAAPGDGDERRALRASHMRLAFPRESSASALPAFERSLAQSNTRTVASPLRRRRLRQSLALAPAVAVVGFGTVLFLYSSPLSSRQPEASSTLAPPERSVSAPPPAVPIPETTPVSAAPVQPPMKMKMKDPASPTSSRKRSARARGGVSGTLELRVYPWAMVFIDGELVGPTPLQPLPLAAGKHSVILVNDALDRRRHFTVEIAQGQTRSLKVVMDE